MSDYDKFAYGLRDAFLSPQNLLYFLLMFLIAGLAVLVIWLIVRSYRKYAAMNLLVRRHIDGVKTPPKRMEAFNPAQKNALSALIRDFKRKELIAEAIPIAVLERFAEHLYQHIDQLRIPDEFSKSLEKKIYPLRLKTPVELEVYLNEKLYLFSRDILAVTDKALTVETLDGLPMPLRKGDPLNISYTVNNEFISGESSVLNFAPADRMVLAYPSKLRATNYRFFTRAPADGITAELAEVTDENPQTFSVRLMDISSEGARLRTVSLLRKSMVYHLSFTDKGPGREFAFRNFECVVTKSYQSATGTYDFGMSFVYVDLENRERLLEYIRALIKKAAGR